MSIPVKTEFTQEEFQEAWKKWQQEQQKVKDRVEASKNELHGVYSFLWDAWTGFASAVGVARVSGNLFAKAAVAQTSKMTNDRLKNIFLKSVESHVMLEEGGFIPGFEEAPEWEKSPQLFQEKAQILASSCGVSEKNLEVLKNHLQTLNDEQRQALGKQMQFIESWMQSQDRAVERRAVFSGYQNAGTFFEQLGGVLKIPELKSFGCLVRESSKISEAASELLNPLKQLKGAALLGPMGVIGSSALNIIGLFLDEGPDGTTLILNKLDEISKQIEHVAKHLDQKLDHIEELQQKTLSALKEGFVSLHEHVENKVGAAFVTLQNNIDGLHRALDFAIRYSAEQTRDIILQDLSKVKASANHSIAGFHVGEDVKTAVSHILQDLSIWGECQSRERGILNGKTFFKVWSKTFDPGPVLEYWEMNTGSNSAALNLMIGWLFEYGQFLNPAPRKSFSPVNPWIWLESLETFCKLRLHHKDLKIDPNQVLLKKLIEAGSSTLDEILEISSDKNLWDALLGNYNKAMKAAEKSFNRYIQQSSNDILAPLNRSYSSLSENPQEAVKVDFYTSLNEIDLFVQKFASRKIAHLNQEIQTLPSTAGTICDPEFRGYPVWQRDPLQKIFHDRDLPKYTERPAAFGPLSLVKAKAPLYRQTEIPPQYLAAEFLQQAQFSAAQSASLTGIRIAEYIYGNMGWHGYGPWGGNQCKNHSGSFTAFDPPFEGWMNKQESWQLPIQVKIDDVPIAEFEFSGKWPGIAPCDADATHVACAALNGVKNICVHHIKDDGQRLKLANHLIAHIGWLWKHSPQSISKSSYKPLNPNKLAAVRESIYAFFANRRKELASDLKRSVLDNHPPVNASQALALARDDLRKSLKSLDMHTAFIRLFLDLSGKKTEGTWVENLVSSSFLNKRLSAYKKLQKKDFMAELAKPFFSDIWDTGDLSFDDVQKLSNRSVDEMHPIRLLSAGLNKAKLTATVMAKIHSNYAPLQEIAKLCAKAPKASAPSFSEAPKSKPSRSLEFTSGGKKYRIEKTKADGACAFHALLGQQVGDEYVYKTNTQARAEYVNLVGPVYATNQQLKLCLEDALLEYVTQFHQTSDDVRSIFSQVPTTVRDLILARNTVEKNFAAAQTQQEALFTQLKAIQDLQVQSAIGTIAKKTWAQLVADAKFANILRGNLNQVIQALGSDPLGQALTQNRQLLDRLNNDKASLIARCIQSPEVKAAYLAACSADTYQLSFDELAVLSELSNLQVTLFRQGDPNPIVYNAGQNRRNVVIYYANNHYSRCTEL